MQEQKYSTIHRNFCVLIVAIISFPTNFSNVWHIAWQIKEPSILFLQLHIYIKYKFKILISKYSEQ